ncbi:MAG: hypothetical protein HYX24_01565 [Candidatus Aenigmarchaeota archaeon]|nr:hypothetical protein [Candidatus Aenigmarchaeota archaeon]
MVDILVRKKVLKIQERLGMRIGIPYGTKDILADNQKSTIEVLKELYKIGLKSFVLPKELFANISHHSEVYKVRYAELLKIKDEAKRYNIELALRHDSLSSEPDETLRIFTTVASIMDCRGIIIQPNFYSKIMPKDQALKLAVYKINEITTSSGFKTKLGIETTGKTNDVGSLEDVIDIVKRTHSTEAVINWGHLHARERGWLRARTDFGYVIKKLRESIGLNSIHNAYFFFSGVNYGKDGFAGHLPYEKADINLEHMIRESMSAGVKGTLIFEDPNKENFVLKLMDKLADMVR